MVALVDDDDVPGLPRDHFSEVGGMACLVDARDDARVAEPGVVVVTRGPGAEVELELPELPLYVGDEPGRGEIENSQPRLVGQELLRR